MHRFRERAPRIDVVLRTSRQVMDFRRDAIDLAIRFAPAPGRGLQGELLCREELFPVASPQLFRGGCVPDTLAALAEYPLLHDTDAGTEQPWLGWRGWFERARTVHRGCWSRAAIQRFHRVDRRRGGRTRHRHRSRAACQRRCSSAGQLVRVTQETWMAPWSYYLMAPVAHFRRPIVRTFVDWALEEARATAPLI